MIRRYSLLFLAILTLNFFIPRLMPGDPFLYLSVEDGNTNALFSEEQIAYYMSYYGLDAPLWKQYIDYLVNIATFDLGYSIYYNDSVLHMIATRIGWTLLIVLVSLILSSIIGLILGGISAYMKRVSAENSLYFVMIFLSEIPAFIIGLLLLIVFAVYLKWFPLSGGVQPFTEVSLQKEVLLDILRHAILPIATLTIARVGEFYLLSRSNYKVVLQSDFIRTAQAKGIGHLRILFKHATLNVLPPIISRVFISLGALFGGAILVENIFDYPGVGKLMNEAVIVRDYILLQGIFLFITLLVVAMNLVADLLNKRLDPRGRL